MKSGGGPRTSGNTGYFYLPFRELFVMLVSVHSGAVLIGFEVEAFIDRRLSVLSFSLFFAGAPRSFMFNSLTVDSCCSAAN